MGMLKIFSSSFVQHKGNKMKLSNSSIELLIKGLDYLIMELDNQIAICTDIYIYEAELIEYKKELTRVNRLHTYLNKKLK